MMAMVVTTGAVRHTELQSSCQHQQNNTQIFTGWMPFLLPTQQCQSTEGKLMIELVLTVILFLDIYISTGEVLGEGSFGQVMTHRNINTGKEYAVKVRLA